MICIFSCFVFVIQFHIYCQTESEQGSTSDSTSLSELVRRRDGADDKILEMMKEQLADNEDSGEGEEADDDAYKRVRAYINDIPHYDKRLGGMGGAIGGYRRNLALASDLFNTHIKKRANDDEIADDEIADDEITDGEIAADDDDDNEVKGDDDTDTNKKYILDKVNGRSKGITKIPNDDVDSEENNKKYIINKFATNKSNEDDTRATKRSVRRTTTRAKVVDYEIKPSSVVVLEDSSQETIESDAINFRQHNSAEDSKEVNKVIEKRNFHPVHKMYTMMHTIMHKMKAQDENENKYLQDISKAHALINDLPSARAKLSKLFHNKDVQKDILERIFNLVMDRLKYWVQKQKQSKGQNRAQNKYTTAKDHFTHL